ncbi:beta family protein [Bradyrhizobium sp. USDA 4520]
MVDFSEFSYVPILEVRPSEMTAMEELAPSDKERLLPHITLRPWLSAHHIEPVIAKIEAAVGHRPVIVDVTHDPFVSGEGRKPVHDSLDALRDPTDGYSNFYDFVDEHEKFVPTLQLASRREVPAQIPRARALGRGIVVKLTEPGFGASVEIAEQLTGMDQEKVYFIFDYQRQNRELLARAAGAIALINGIREILPDCFVSVSASTFPSSFVGIHRQAIFERLFYDEVVRQVQARKVIYSDTGSVRKERQAGASGPPPPRIDNAMPREWAFFRVDDDDLDRDAAYQRAATRAIRSEGWMNLGVWGTTQIINTANGAAAIISPQRSTAVRINIHLHQQANFGALPAPDVESDWTD